MRNAAEINWDYLGESLSVEYWTNHWLELETDLWPRAPPLGDAIPAFLTILIIPTTYNIAYGLIAGICSMLIVKLLPKLVYDVSLRPTIYSITQGTLY